MGNNWREVLSWIDANGTEHVLTGQPGWDKLGGWTGRFMPSLTFVEQVTPLQPGSTFRNIVIAPRDISFPMLVRGVSPMDARNNLRLLLNMFNPNNGQGRLRITAFDGSQREIYCRYSGGLEGAETPPFGSSSSSGGSGGTVTQQMWMTVVLSFHAFDPYWYSTATNIRTFTSGTMATFFPFFPLKLSSSQVFASPTVQNEGDVEAWPVWIIQGPGSAIQLVNLTTGYSITLNVVLGEGESITIDTTKGNKTVTKSDGTNLYGALASGSSLWSLQPGANSIEIAMSDSTSDSYVQLTYKNQYLGA